MQRPKPASIGKVQSWFLKPNTSPTQNLSKRKMDDMEKLIHEALELMGSDEAGTTATEPPIKQPKQVDNTMHPNMVNQPNSTTIPFTTTERSLSIQPTPEPGKIVFYSDVYPPWNRPDDDWSAYLKMYDDEAELLD